MYSSNHVFFLIIMLTTLLPRPGIAQVPDSSRTGVASQTSPPQISGRLHPRYQVFARQTALPSITVTTNDLLVIGGTARFDVGHRDQILAQLKPLSEQVGVPASALETILKGLKTNGEPAASELRASLVDYKYLLELWTQYHPPPGQETRKNEALRLLQAGELEQVWRLFDSLPRPKPPAGLRVVDSH